MRCGKQPWRSCVSRYDLVIFDWDGTLVDSIGRIVDGLRFAADAHGLPQLEDQTLRDIIGLSLPQAFHVLHPDAPEQVTCESFCEAYAGYYLPLEAKPSQPYAGVVLGLDRLSAAGIQLAVATGKSRRGLDSIMSGLKWQERFVATRCADETASKPNPLMLQEILAVTGVPMSRAVMVGDSVFDLRMAEQAGMDSVGVSYGAQSAEVLKTCEPKAMFRSFDELLSWLLSVD